MSDRDNPNESDEEIQDSLEQLVQSIEERRQTNDTDGSNRDGSTPTRPEALDELVDEPSRPSQPPETNIEASDFKAIEDIENVLVLGPLRGRSCNETCGGLLAVTEPENVLFVTLTHAAEERLDVIDHIEGAPPERAAVIRVGSSDQAQEHSSISPAVGPSELSVSGVGDPSDLTRLGIAISRCYSQWPSNTQTTACIHSLTELLQYADQQRLFRFIHILQAKFDTTNTSVHFHMDPSAHSEQSVSIFRTLFDTVVEIDEGGVTITNTDD